VTIEVHQPELEALIRERMESGRFTSVEDALLDALKPASPPEGESRERTQLTGADLLAAMQRSPYKEVDLEPSRPHLPVRDAAL
jgi:hypothetical protein